MPETFYNILTNKGLEKDAAAKAGGAPLDFANLAVGDSGGAYFEPLATQVSLVNEMWRGAVNRVYVHPSNVHWVVVEALIPVTDGGFDIREVGVFDAAGDLLAVGKYPLTTKPAQGSGSEKDLYVRMIFQVTNAASVVQTIDPTLVMVTQEYVDQEVAGHDHDLDYAAAGHDHDLDYAAAGHNHDLDYAAAGHDHDLDYAAAAHDHGGLTGYVNKASGGDLDATHVGNTVRVAIDSASTVAMPPTTSLSAGQKIEVVNHGSGYLQLTGSNMLVPPYSGVTSGVILEIGDSATFTFTSSAWALTGGSVLHRYSAAFHSIHGGTSGYQILPAGFGLPDARTIIQWGFVTIGEFSDYYNGTINFPVQFTTSCDNIQITNKRTASTINWDTFTEVIDFANNDLASFTYKVHDANADGDKTGFFWLAIGR